MPSWLRRPMCRRCGQPAEQCLYYRPAECIGVPLPKHIGKASPGDLEFLQNVEWGQQRQRAGGR